MQDLTGQLFGQLTVNKFAGKNKYSHNQWEVTCVCGTIKTVLSQHLLAKKTVSCGCFADKRRFKHGEAVNDQETNLYKRWCGIKNRCYTVSCSSYKNYGGRGIKVCDEWKDNYPAFRDWALANGYKKSLEIDRRDGNKDYCPENCRWVTKKKNSMNKRR